jgi:hypothetical protein
MTNLRSREGWNLTQLLLSRARRLQIDPRSRWRHSCSQQGGGESSAGSKEAHSERAQGLAYQQDKDRSRDKHKCPPPQDQTQPTIA